MITEGQIVLFKFPRTNQMEGKVRPALVIRQLPDQRNDWLICMISSQIHQAIPEFDEVITPNDPDFEQSGLKLPSVVRISRLAPLANTKFATRNLFFLICVQNLVIDYGER